MGLCRVRQKSKVFEGSTAVIGCSLYQETHGSPAQNRLEQVLEQQREAFHLCDKIDEVNNLHGGKGNFGSWF
jgi:hypothetical protein